MAAGRALLSDRSRTLWIATTVPIQQCAISLIAPQANFGLKQTRISLRSTRAASRRYNAPSLRVKQSARAVAGAEDSRF